VGQYQNFNVDTDTIFIKYRDIDIMSICYKQVNIIGSPTHSVC